MKMISFVSFKKPRALNPNYYGACKMIIIINQVISLALEVIKRQISKLTYFHPP